MKPLSSSQTSKGSHTEANYPIEHRRLIRAAILHCPDTLDAQTLANDEIPMDYWQDGLLVIERGHVHYCGDYSAYSINTHELEQVEHHVGKLIVPGFIDCHVHYPQTQMIAAYGTQLLEWLERYTFPVEAQFADYDKALAVAEVFCRELLRHGTTTALVFCRRTQGLSSGFFYCSPSHAIAHDSGQGINGSSCPCRGNRHAPIRIYPE